MRLPFTLLTLSLTLASALAIPGPSPENGVIVAPALGKKAVPLGRERELGDGKNTPIGTTEETVNYLVSLSRTVTNGAKDTLLDKLMRSGAVVKQIYDYRVYKGVLFSIPTNLDQGLMNWEKSLVGLEGVKSVEEDSLVKTN